MINEEEFLKEHPSFDGGVVQGFMQYDPDIWELIHKTQLDKQKVKEVLDTYNIFIHHPILYKELGL